MKSSQVKLPAEQFVNSPVFGAPDDSRRLSICRLVSRLAALLAIAVGGAVLIGGWGYDVESLKVVLSGYPAMHPNTAVGLLFCGIALWLDDPDETHRIKRFVGRMCAAIGCLIGSARLIQYLPGNQLAIGSLPFFDDGPLVEPGRMAIMSALALLLLASTLLLSRQRGGFALGQYIVVVVAILSLFNLIACVYGIRTFSGLAFKAGSTTMAIHTALTLLVLCAGTLLSRPDWSLILTMNSPAPGSIMARQLLPAALLIPLVTSWLRWRGQLAGLYDTDFGETLSASIIIAVLAFLIWTNGQKLNKLDVKRSLAERNLRQLADSMPQMVWAATPAGHIDYYNQRWYEYTGLNLEQTRNWDWKLGVHPDDQKSASDIWTRALNLGVVFEVECRFRCGSNQTYRWHLCRARPVRDAQGAIMRWFGSCTDIEDQKRAETEIKILNEGLEKRVRERISELDRTVQQLARANDELKDSSLRLERSNRELQDFASVASHDLQEPLRKVQTFGDRLRTVSREAMGEQGRDYLDRMLNATKRMNSLIQDLLSFARVTSEAHAFLPVDLAQVMRDVLSDLEVQIDETKALVVVGALPTIDANAGQIRQLLQNLVGNALKFRQNGRTPELSIYTQEDELQPRADAMLQLIVKDNGIGFDEKYLDRIFTVFQRLHGRTEYEGTGVGLAICRKIAQWHGGDITAKSTPGQGASFLVALPLHHVQGN